MCYPCARSICYQSTRFVPDVIAGALIGIVVAYLVCKLRDLIMPLLIWVIKAARIISLACLRLV